MTVKVVVGRTEGFVSSVGLVSNEGGRPFLASGLHWESAETWRHTVRELRFLLAYLQSAGVVVENINVLDTLGRS